MYAMQCSHIYVGVIHHPPRVRRHTSDKPCFPDYFPQIIRQQLGISFLVLFPYIKASVTQVLLSGATPFSAKL